MRFFRHLKHLWPFKKDSSLKPIPLLDMPPDENAAWWGTFRVAKEEPRYSKIGPLVLCIDRAEQEWHIACFTEGAPAEESQSKVIDLRSSQEEITLKPSLPDRNLLAFLKHALFIPPNGEVTVYISTPIWIRIEIGVPPSVLDEMAIHTLSDTWFGRNTLMGELCYAAPYPATFRPDDLPRDNIHTLTPISITNQTGENRVIQAFNIPLPSLAIYHDKQNTLWTERLHLELTEFNQSELYILKGPPEGLAAPEPLCHPRTLTRHGFKGFFGRK